MFNSWVILPGPAFWTSAMRTYRAVFLLPAPLLSFCAPDVSLSLRTRAQTYKPSLCCHSGQG